MKDGDEAEEEGDDDDDEDDDGEDGDNGEAQDDDGEVLPEEEDQPHLLPLASKLGCLTVLTNKLLHNPQIILSLVITLDWMDLIG